MKILLRVLIVFVFGLSGIVAYMVGFEKDYIYFPEREVMRNPAEVGLRFRVERLKTSDGVTLNGWYMPHTNARFTLLHLHGNRGNMGDRIKQYRRWHDMGLAVLAIDYRGYGQSEGEPGEAGLYADAQAAWKLLTGKYGIPPQNIIIAGRSLGCAVAAQLVAQLPTQVKPAGLALEVPFTSLPDMSAAHYPWLPLRWFVRSRFDVEAAVRKVQVPLLLISATADKVIPAGMAERVYVAAGGNKKGAGKQVIHSVLSGGHNNFDSISQSAYFRLWQRWLNSLTPLKPVEWVLREKGSKG